MSVPCPLCRADDAVVVHHEHTRYFGTPVSFTITRCRQCGMVYTNPRLADVNLAYEERSEIDKDQSRRYHDAKRPVFRKALRRICRLKPPPARLLDIGCGSGEFLAMARETGYEIAGVEASAVDVEAANERLGNVVTQGWFEQVDLEQDSADVVTAWDVIEHVADPRAMVRKAFDVLRTDGVLAMRMPGAGFHRIKALVLALLRGRNATVYSPVIHLNFFSPHTIRKLLEDEGLEVVSIGVTTPEGHSRKWIGRAARLAWGYAAGFLRVLTGACLDNLEVYARKSSHRPKSTGSVFTS